MEILKIKANQLIAKKRDKVREWYLIQEGTVVQKFDFAEVALGKNAIIGILASDSFPCDYIAQTDVTLAVFKCENYEELKQTTKTFLQIITSNDFYYGLFLIAVIIVLAMNLVGSLLISALVIFPALSAMRLFRSFMRVTDSSIRT